MVPCTLRWLAHCCTSVVLLTVGHLRWLVHCCTSVVLLTLRWKLSAVCLSRCLNQRKLQSGCRTTSQLLLAAACLRVKLQLWSHTTALWRSKISSSQRWVWKVCSTLLCSRRVVHFSPLSSAEPQNAEAQEGLREDSRDLPPAEEEEPDRRGRPQL